MHVLEHQPSSWFLLGDGDRLLLDVACEHHGVGYSVLVELNADERASYESRGWSYVDALARSISDSAPHSRGSSSPYGARDLTAAHREDVHAAIMAWRQREMDARKGGARGGE